MAILVGFTALCHGCQVTPAPSPKATFQPSSIECHPDGSVAKGLLTAPATIGGVPCQGWVRLQPDGRLSSFELAANTTIQGHELPAASYVWLDDDARLQTCFLLRDTQIQSYRCRGGPFKIATSFHANGMLRAFFPRDEVTIDGIPCAATTQAPVYLHESGKLAGCRLAADTTVEGKVTRRGETIQIDEDGHLSEPGR
jgi:hypothetical protein